MPSHIGCAAGALLASIALFTSACKSGPPEGEGRGAALYAICAPCHGSDGSGNRDYQAPAIAGLDDWYVTLQLDKFRNGLRGAHPDDVEGLRMRPMARTLKTDVDVAAVSAYVAAMKPTNPSPVLTGGDAKKGADYFPVCTACHGPAGEGKRDVSAPRLTGANDWYLVTQLNKFLTKVRGANPDDATGATMGPMAMTLTTDQAVLDVVAYIQTLPDEE
jgi:cytochrome c553